MVAALEGGDSSRLHLVHQQLRGQVDAAKAEAAQLKKALAALDFKNLSQ